MFFGKNQPGAWNQSPAEYMTMQPEMINQDIPQGGFAPEQNAPEGLYPYQSAMGYAGEPYYNCPSDEKEKPVYVVQKGDTVYKIANSLGVDWRELAEYNHLSNPSRIYPGERLFIPKR